MKTLHSLKAWWLFLAMVLVTALGETVAWQLSRSFNVRFSPVAVAAICIGITAAVTAWIYDGCD